MLINCNFLLVEYPQKANHFIMYKRETNESHPIKQKPVKTLQPSALGWALHDS